MQSVIFSFATHNHQPNGNFEHVFEESFQKSYRPFFEIAAKYPRVRFATHFTGILLEWLETHHPEYLAQLKRMAASGQIELLSGGYYEPILSTIPMRDQQAQIALLSEKIGELFQAPPTGMWLAERVWEQSLARVLHRAGVRYVLLDDTHFLYAGLTDSDLTGYYITEDAGNPLAVFPISKPLRYAIPFMDVSETLRVLRDHASERGDRIITFADDGEKFGVWPHTFDHVYTNGWLEEFFATLSENASWISFQPPGEALRRVQPLGRIYLPTASYAEMMQWSLPTAEANARYEAFTHELDREPQKWEPFRSFVRGGYWRNFFVKYPESNQLHKHVLRTSARLQSLEDAGHKLPEARRELMKAQCNDPYWHGVFGGIYLSNLRHANFSAVVRADALLDRAEYLNGVRMTAEDFDCDGAEEIILESPCLSVYLKPSLGGMISEIDFKPRAFNATNILTRHKEAYHANIASAQLDTSDNRNTEAASIHRGVKTKEAGLEKLLHYDPYRRGCMIEHFIPFDATPDWQNGVDELAGDVTSAFDWDWSVTERRLRLTRHAAVSNNPILVTKVLSLAADTGHLQVTYRILNESTEFLRFQFASEWAFHLLAPDAPDRYYESNGQKLPAPAMRSSGIVNASDLRLVDDYLKLAISIEGGTAIVRYPLETVSMSEGGFERVFQGSIVMPIWNVELSPRSEWHTALAIQFDTLA